MRDTITNIEQGRADDPREINPKWEDRIRLARQLADRLRDIANCLEESVEDPDNWRARKTVEDSLQYGIISVGTPSQLDRILSEE